jgi:outer membrane receptor protein involved in Fe transport
VTPLSQFSSRPGLTVHGGLNVFGATADRANGAVATLLLSGPHMSWIVGGARRQLDDVRAGGGRDSHHVLRRLFGLSDDQIRGVTGTLHDGTGFSQSGFHTKMAARLGQQQNLTLWYQHSALEDVRGYKDLWGGLGRLQSDVDPQRLDFLYARYEKLAVGRLDWLSATISLNSQDEGSIRQNLRATDLIVHDDSRVDALGYAVQAGAHAGGRHSFVFGGETYDERVDALREETDPRTGITQQRRALYPNGSRYRTSGAFVQDAVDLLKGAWGSLRANAGGRFTHVRVDTSAEANRNSSGQSLGVVDSSQSYQDWTFNSGLTWQVNDQFAVNALVGRGFRAPNLNDLGALGLNDLGYEVPAEATLEGGGQIGTSDGEGALSSGRQVGALKAERLFNYEVGTSVRWRRLFARASAFDAEFEDPIVRRTILFPLDGPPSALAGLTVTPIAPSSAQRAQGVTSVATTLDPRAVKAFVNDGRIRYYGLDALVSYRASTRWLAEANYSYLVGHDLHPTRPVRRLPPQQGFLAVRYQPGGRLPWVEARARFSGAQTELSGGDLTDERIGGARRRSDITDFFQGTRMSPYVLPGGDGRVGTADDVLSITGETVAQIRDRVLPIGDTINGVRITDDSTRVPMLTRTPGFATLDLRAGAAISDRVDLNLALINVLDRNYRVHGSGVDGPGISIYAGVNVAY